MTAEPLLTGVLDASALLAFVHGEPGGEAVRAMLKGAAISSVNWAEVVQKSLARGVDIRGLREDLEAMGLCVLPFTGEDAELTARLWSRTRSLGLSLGDRACLALGQSRKLPVLTADRTWTTLALEVEVRSIR